MKVKFWIYIENLMDGDVCVRIFNSKEAAEKYASYDEERYGNDISQEEIEIDEFGYLIYPNPIHYLEENK